METVKLDIGCKGNRRPGYIGIDCVPGEDVDHVINCFGQNNARGYCYPDGWQMPQLDQQFPFGTVDAIHTHHVIEHIPWKVAPAIIAHWCQLLKPGGTWFSACPDLGYLMRAYVTRNWGIKPPEEHGNVLPATFGNYLDEGYGEPMCHRGGFDFPLLVRYLENAGMTSVTKVSSSEWQPYADWELAVVAVKI